MKYEKDISQKAKDYIDSGNFGQAINKSLKEKETWWDKMMVKLFG